MKTKIKVVVCVAAAVAVSLLSILAYRAVTNPKTTINDTLVKERIMKCAELVSIKYEYSRDIMIKKAALIPVFSSFETLRYTGIIRVGIKDISLCNVKVDGNIIRISIPKSEMLGSDIENVEVLDSSTGMLTKISDSETYPQIMESKRSVECSQKISELISEADDHNVSLIKSLFDGYDVMVDVSEYE